MKISLHGYEKYRAIFSAVAGLTQPRWFNTRSTVPLDTPASAAISLMVAMLSPFQMPPFGGCWIVSQKYHKAG